MQRQLVPEFGGWCDCASALNLGQGPDLSDLVGTFCCKRLERFIETRLITVPTRFQYQDFPFYLIKV